MKNIVLLGLLVGSGIACFASEEGGFLSHDQQVLDYMNNRETENEEAQKTAERAALEEQRAAAAKLHPVLAKVADANIQVAQKEVPQPAATKSTDVGVGLGSWLADFHTAKASVWSAMGFHDWAGQSHELAAEYHDAVGKGDAAINSRNAAIGSYNTAVDKAVANTDFLGQADAHAKIAGVYADLGNAAAAQRSIQSALSTYQSHAGALADAGDLAGSETMYNNLEKYYLNQGDTGAAQRVKDNSISARQAASTRAQGL
ncbi:hypothetical protein EBR77_03805 [bacterium]|nr:hypothetical protein [bacterium]NBX78038.1 hypothetical protein [bacterium]